MKEHFIKEYIKDVINLDTVTDCEYIFSMEIKLDKCSRFCYFYKNMTEFDEMTNGRVSP